MADETNSLIHKVFAEKTILTMLYEITGEGRKIRNELPIYGPFRNP